MSKSHYTMREVAEVVGMSTACLYVRAMYKKDIPAPSERIGKRDFYTAAQVEAMKPLVAELRAAGKLRTYKKVFTA